MEALLDGMQWLIDSLTQFWNLLMSFLESIILSFRYIAIVRDIALDAITTLPSWLLSFATITLIISVVYLVVGRETGK